MENLEEYQPLVKLEKGQEVLNLVTLTYMVTNIELELKIAKDNESKMRASILEAMLKTNTPTAKIGDYVISQVLPKDIVEFNTDKFLEEQSQDVINAFCTVESNDEFDLERFKKEQPEMYKKYTKTNDEVKVDLSKLEKSLPNVFKKYATITPNKEGKVTLRIAKSKKKE